MVQEKKVVEEVSGWLQLFDDGSVERRWTGATAVEPLVKPVPAHLEFIDGVATRDVIIDPNSGLSIRIYIPETKPHNQTKLPVLLHFHGGGFCICRADWYMYYQFYTRLVRSAQAVCVSVEMRLAPEHRLPAAYDDCYSALLWLRSVARAESTEPWLKAHADFSRVFLIGDSSGANLVHVISTRAGSAELEPLRITGSVPLHPGFVRAERSKSELELQSDSVFLTLDMIDKFLNLALPLGSTKDHPITCPMGEAAPPLEGLRMPPAMVAVAEKDLMRDTQLEYCEAMKKAGKDVEVVVSVGVGHCFYLDGIAVAEDPHTAVQTEELVAKIKEFIDKH